MSTDLLAWVDDQLVRTSLDDAAAIIVLAALEGDHHLDGYLDSGESHVRERATTEAVAATEAGGTFLASITVEGFRGIGPEVFLELSPRPVLTIVAGRNGSGKSSISEALELVLTGDTYRWKKRSSQWKEQWRNLHHPAARIVVQVVEEDSGPVTVSTSWADSAADVAQRTTNSQRHGQKQQDGLGDLGWERPLERFRPILSYDELGGMLEGSPSELHDAIAKVLGTEQLGDALKRIQLRLKTRKAPGDEATKRRRLLVAQAEDLADERATLAARLLRKTSPDVSALRALATGSSTVDQGPIPALRQLAALEAPLDEMGSRAAAARLRDAVARLAGAKSDLSARTVARLDLLQRALEVHAAHGEMTCPVCQRSTLDGAWAATSRDLLAQQRAELDEVETARQTVQEALHAAQRTLTPAPALLNRSPVPDMDEVVAVARTAWDDWAAGPRGNDVETANALADHLELHAAELKERLADVRVAANRTLGWLEDAWQPLATQIGAWCDAWVGWMAEKDVVDTLVAAEKWLKDNDLRLKNELLSPIRDGAAAAWAKLRQESNVEIGNLALEGTATRRKVVIKTQVDGAEASSLAVLSQGELHALALSLFLPRATMSESPFRFVVLDDPVQAMDPAKVDGLVDLLGELARTHQVIVMSHDDRLPAAVRRSDLSATILEVSRGVDSQVFIDVATDPATRYLSDAFALVKEHEEDRLPGEALRRTLPGLLRFAAEAAARDTFYATSLAAGAALAEVESAWRDALTTRKRITLAVFGEPRENHELDQWASAPHRKFALKTIGPGMHSGLRENLDPRESARHVQRLVKDLAEGLR